VLPDPKSNLLFVGLEAIEPHTMKIATATPFSAMRSAANQFEKGDVLYGRLRPYLNKVAVAESSGACSGELLVLRPRRDVSSRYLAFALHERRFLDFAVHAVSGDRPRIGFDAMAAFPLPIPSFDTQQRIDARIGELFAELEDAEEALARARKDLGGVAQGVAESSCDRRADCRLARR
jgi:type I restriction enzyme S subunit